MKTDKNSESCITVPSCWESNVELSNYRGKGIRDPSRRKWSEERQCDILDNTLKIFMGNENVSGVFIWQFCDCCVTEEDDWFVSRVCMRNNKGVVDIYCRPKMACEMVKKNFNRK